MKNIFLGGNQINREIGSVEGGFTDIGQEKFYKISNYNLMDDFFMTIVSDSNHWMYLSSTGALSAGRKNRDSSLFPYYTVDKIHDYKGKTGSKTICLVSRKEKTFLWEPFSDEAEKVYGIKRNMYKSIYGNKVIFEEINTDLELSFRYGWYNSDKYGWIRKSTIHNLSEQMTKVELLDGIHNLLPSSVDYAFQNEYSNLLDAYKKNELLDGSKLGLFILSSIPVDRAEPSEALKATSVWALLPDKEAKYLLSDRQITKFISGHGVQTESDVRAARGAYYVNVEFELGKDEKQEWYLVAEVNQDASDVRNLDRFLQSETDIEALLTKDIQDGTRNLIRIVANADGLQMGNEVLGFARHFSNTLFNFMRGGIFNNNYTINTEDFKLYVLQCNKNIWEYYAPAMEALPEEIKRQNLLNWIEESGSPELVRIAQEYLPLTFSRRHGDPSRPWNQFSIETKNEDGSEKLYYQGNWRDIFQNWEALCLSYPEYIEGIIAKFVNASTADGYNPYRITRDGIDWECLDPDDPWGYIGYWGDHQIIYLLKFFELSEDFHPGKLDELLTQEIFVYANVPYRIRSFNDLVKDPKETIDFDYELNSEIESRVKITGADGKLLYNMDGEIYRVNLMEKVLATLLSKISNFIPEAGIWMNTQRPEWNDANNALVGNGVSMVTLYYLHRFLNFWNRRIERMKTESYQISTELKQLFDRVLITLEENIDLLSTGFTDETRFEFAAALGIAGSDYRNAIYRDSFSGEKQKLSIGQISKLIELALQYTHQSIQKNKREDGLYHAYNLISFHNENVRIRYLYEMLEGQVAVLSSGILNTTESLEVLDALKGSKIFREDQYSYMLYPDRQLPLFIEKNIIPAHKLDQSVLLKSLVSTGSNPVVQVDQAGQFHFDGRMRNAGVLNDTLDKLDKDKYGELVKQEREKVLQIYEEVFDHQSFTGRSGTFYGYEGLGSIYWHMVSKLLLAVQECFEKGIKEGATPEIIGRIKEHYYEIKAGIGLYKSPELYGAFPTDAYSHTPANAGAKQPGLTGQVKEDVITRFGELGLQIKEGEISFQASLLNPNELLKNSEVFNYFSLDGDKKTIHLRAGQLAYTICQVPVVYKPGGTEELHVLHKDGTSETIQGSTLDRQTSAKIFTRTGDIALIELTIGTELMKVQQHRKTATPDHD